MKYRSREFDKWSESVALEIHIFYLCLNLILCRILVLPCHHKSINVIVLYVISSDALQQFRVIRDHLTQNAW